jgi:hypothetical protein
MLKRADKARSAVLTSDSLGLERAKVLTSGCRRRAEKLGDALLSGAAV